MNNSMKNLSTLETKNVAGGFDPLTAPDGFPDWFDMDLIEETRRWLERLSSQNN